MSSISLAENGVFHTIQGEGHLLGQPMTFIRLAGCSVGCAGCDTNYRKVRRASVADIVDEVCNSMPFEIRDPWVWITGGEPADQDITQLVRELKKQRYSVAVATSGIKRIAIPVDWLSVSPHSTELRMRWGNEIKIVPGLNGLDAEDWIATNDSSIDFWLRFLQPFDEDPDSLALCLKIQDRFPHWGLTLQAHKIWGLP